MERWKEWIPRRDIRLRVSHGSTILKQVVLTWYHKMIILSGIQAGMPCGETNDRNSHGMSFYMKEEIAELE